MLMSQWSQWSLSKIYYLPTFLVGVEGGGGGCGNSMADVTDKVNSSLEKQNFFAFSLPVPSQLILKYAYMQGILIHHIVHITDF